MLKCWGIHTKKSVAALLATMMLTVSGGTAMAVEKDTTIKNVIILIPDGMANDATALARWYKGSSLTLDSMASGWCVHILRMHRLPILLRRVQLLPQDINHILGM